MLCGMEGVLRGQVWRGVVTAAGGVPTTIAIIGIDIDRVSWLVQYGAALIGFRAALRSRAGRLRVRCVRRLS